MTFAGGLGLGAYHAGVYESFAVRGLPLHWVSGSSAGAVTAALIGGNRESERIARLRSFWQNPAMGFVETAQWRHLFGWMAAIQSRLFGRVGFFHPRLPSLDLFRFRSLYDLSPMKERLTRLIDFGRLNSGELRVSIVATDIESGAPVIFDTSEVTLGMDHLLASCGFLPEFAPVEINGRLLGDGGLSLNAPFDPILGAPGKGDLMLYVVDLYARDGARPLSLEAAVERKNDLLFGNQTYIRLSYLAENRALRRKEAAANEAEPEDRIVLLSYRPGMEEPGPEKPFELSCSAFAQRWRAGQADMAFAQCLPLDKVITVARRR